MNVSAKINMDYLWRTALFSLVFAGWGAWSLYDGLVTYPNFNQEHDYETYVELRQKCEKEALTNNAEAVQSPYERRDAIHKLWATKYRQRFLRHLETTDWWKSYEQAARTDEGAPRRGAEALSQLEHDFHSDWDIRAQYFMAIVCLPLGLSVAFALLRNLTRSFRADDEGLHGFGATTIPYEAVREIDRAKWQRKGIAKVIVDTEKGTEKLTLDEWKFKGAADILAAIEEKRPDLAPEEEPQGNEGDAPEESTPDGLKQAEEGASEKSPDADA